jgi:mRNA-degrading endonuclease RelE of RelBE toxin-antitoxin system
MENQIEIRKVLYSDEFNLFYSELDKTVQEKFKQAIDIIKTIYVINTKFVKRLINTNLYEMRVSVGFNEYRTIIFAIDNENIIQSTQIILLNGFLKKSSKDYNKQIKKAINILNTLEL